MWHWRLSNDAEYSAVHHRNTLHFYIQIENICAVVYVLDTKENV